MAVDVALRGTCRALIAAITALALVLLAGAVHICTADAADDAGAGHGVSIHVTAFDRDTHELSAPARAAQRAAVESECCHGASAEHIPAVFRDHDVFSAASFSATTVVHTPTVVSVPSPMPGFDVAARSAPPLHLMLGVVRI